MEGGALRLGDGWRLWDQFAVRGAGFPAAGVLRLAPAGLAVAADEFGADEPLSGPDWGAFDKQFDEAASRTVTVLQDIAASSSFRSAVTWQNRASLASGIDSFLARTASGARRTSALRQREELVALYWQRLCVKNDSIGFFGPVGWGRFDSAVAGMEVDPGEGLVATSELYFSSWAVDELAKALSADADLRQWVAPRRLPFVRVGDAVAMLPGRPAQSLTPAQYEVLRRCDGIRSARDLQQELGLDVDVAAVLADLAARRLVVWQLEVPADTHPERRLRSLLEQVGDPVVRLPALDALDVVERGRDGLRGVGDPDGLSAGMAALEAGFAALTETAATRTKGGATAPCRALVYADCRRSASTRFGDDLLAAMAPLAPVLTTAAWLTGQLAERVMAHARAVYDDLSARAGADGVDLAAFWFACMPVLHGDAVTEAAAVQREFRRRWATVLGPITGRRITLSGTEAADRIREAFGAHEAGWTAARNLSPDVLVAASDAAAVGRGEFQLVLGELHLAANTMGESLFVHQHPAPEQLFALTDRDHPEPRLLPLVAKENRSRLSLRTRYCLVRPEDYVVALVESSADPKRPRTVLSADVRVESRDGRLVAVLPDGAVFGVVDAFAHALTTLSMDLFRLLPEADHTPRVTIDRFVIARETWRFSPADADFAEEKDEARRFVRARRWSDAREIPRFVFVTSPAEPRPLFVDFDSPTYVSIFAKAVRRLARMKPAARFAVSEMLPTPEQTWLTDDEGNRYTAELRFVAVDDAE